MPMSSPQMTRMFGCCGLRHHLHDPSRERRCASSGPGDSTAAAYSGQHVRPGRRSLRADDLQPLRAQRPPASRGVARPLAELRARPPARHDPRDRATRVRPRDHALRPRQQLRAAVRLRGGELRPPAPRRLRAVPRRARRLDEGGLRHVARPVRRMGLAQVPAREPRPEPRAAGPRVRRHLLLAPVRPGHAARGDDGRARQRGAAGQGALRRDLVVLGGEDGGGGCDPARPRHARC